MDSTSALPSVFSQLTLSIMAPKRSRADGGRGFPLPPWGSPCTILTLRALFLPETPISLIQRSNNHQKAKQMLQRVRGTGDVQAEHDDLIKASEMSKTIGNPYRKIPETKCRPHFFMAIAISFFQQVTGINVLSFYAPVIFRTMGLGWVKVPHSCQRW